MVEMVCVCALSIQRTCRFPGSRARPRTHESKCKIDRSAEQSQNFDLDENAHIVLVAAETERDTFILKQVCAFASFLVASTPGFGLFSMEFAV
jgi:hypothetical protein